MTVDTSEVDAFFSNIDTKLKTALTGELSNIGTEIQNTTTALAPVDTGYMQSQIKVNTSEDSIEAVAGADYSSYVDLGTFKMAAEPFFTDPINTIANTIPGRLDKAVSDALGVS